MNWFYILLVVLLIYFVVGAILRVIFSWAFLEFLLIICVAFYLVKKFANKKKEQEK